MISSCVAQPEFNKLQMEEQTVPSAGFTPPYDGFDADYFGRQSNQANICDGNNYDGGNGPNNAAVLGIVENQSYSNIAESFDLSLLEDGCTGSLGDSDMATVPSPMSGWGPTTTTEPYMCHQVSFYGNHGSPDFNREFSPDHVKLSMYENGTMIGKKMENQGAIGLGNGDDRHYLLRQCLQDTSFQRKCNFKPLEFPSQADQSVYAHQDIGAVTAPPVEAVNSGTTGSSAAIELNQIEPVFNLAFEQIQYDIQKCCTELSISPDPSLWSSSDVQSWLMYTVKSFETGSLSETHDLRGFWTLDGKMLCSLNEYDFRSRDPLHGDTLFAHLELWKTLQAKSSMGIEDGVWSQGQLFDLDNLLNGTSECSEDGEMKGAGRNGGTVNGHGVTSGGSSPQAESCNGNSMAGSPGGSLKLEPCVPSSVEASPIDFPGDDDEDDDEQEESGKSSKKCTQMNKGSLGSGSKLTGVKSGSHIHLWQFLKELLGNSSQHGSCIRWLDHSQGVFKIEDSVRVARLWGIRKNRPAMNYDKLSRSIRQYYRKGIMRKTERSQRLVYQFCHPYGL